MTTYNSKLLLFGEFAVIKGSPALAIPFDKYSGYWTFSRDKNTSNQELKNWLAYLTQQSFDFPVELERFSSDIKNGLTFHSNIPQGYGVGSSGSLVAAFLDKYVTSLVLLYKEKNDIFLLKNALIQLENYFHGGGSGIDPLVCFLNRSLIFQKNAPLQILKNDFLSKKSDNTACFLINTHQPRKTEPLVTIFHEKCETPNFEELCKSELSALNTNAIQALLSNQLGELLKNVKKISAFQYEHFKPMILEAHFDIWKKGLETDLYYLKLCGAGGGGFMLGFTKDWEATQVHLKDFSPEFVFSI